MAIAFSRLIGPVPISVIVSEKHDSEIEITGNPIETGAEVNDHAYVMPKRVTLDFGDANSTATWQALKRFQESRVPFTLVTGLDVYQNMLIKSISVDRDKTFSSILRGTVDLQEVIIVETAYAANEDGEMPNKSGNPGGKKSTKSSKPSPKKSNNPVTADKASGTVQRGDNPTVSAPTTGSSPAAIKNQSVLKSFF